MTLGFDPGGLTATRVRTLASSMKPDMPRADRDTPDSTGHNGFACLHCSSSPISSCRADRAASSFQNVRSEATLPFRVGARRRFAIALWYLAADVPTAVLGSFTLHGPPVIMAYVCSGCKSFFGRFCGTLFLIHRQNCFLSFSGLGAAQPRGDFQCHGVSLTKYQKNLADLRAMLFLDLTFDRLDQQIALIDPLHIGVESVMLVPKTSSSSDPSARGTVCCMRHRDPPRAISRASQTARQYATPRKIAGVKRHAAPRAYVPSLRPTPRHDERLRACTERCREAGPGREPHLARTRLARSSCQDGPPKRCRWEQLSSFEHRVTARSRKGQ